MADQRPPLTPALAVADFQRFYWLKEELVAFCRQHGLATSGGKLELAARIEHFLATGEIAAPPKAARRPKAAAPAELTLESVIEAGFVCSQRHRAFFKAAIGPKFHFSTFMQNFFKQNVGKTYSDAVAAWHAEEARKKQPGYQTTIAPQFEYNRFIRAFFADPNNQGKTRQDAIAAWNAKRSQPGDNAYSPEHD